MIRVLLVDDHAMLRAGFRTILGTQPDIEVVGEASTGAEAVTAASALQPDVITMDVQMPDMDGLEATRRIVADPAVASAVVIVTTFDRDDYLFDALDAGASGFLLKNAGPEELLTAVRALAAGDGMLAPEVTRRVLTRFSHAPTGSATPAGPGPVRVVDTRVLAEPLTEREAEVLALMADARSNGEIATALYIGEATVKTHVSRILQKLGARDRVQAVVLAHRHGLT
ncbi:DNA-binding response regulator [Microbacterium bovistercoris]|uniref:DNA-binding response regulator n=1 Tax=Microbacterium bovistercoris TaxID=2293570 RepID=A0A371NP48_9MICO|nr:response regulator transcription factor [Microbacterium bovistercoris]REJ03963.1 DNA-binding response regulator [Microbacterium bovistercoris]